MFCIYLRTNSDLCHLQHKLIGFYNRDENCLQRGTEWVFKYSSLRLVFKGLLDVREVRQSLSGMESIQVYIIFLFVESGREFCIGDNKVRS